MLSIMLNYPVMNSLSERERETINKQGTGFNLARLTIVPTIKNLICRCLIFMIVKYDAVENYMFIT